MTVTGRSVPGRLAALERRCAQVLRPGCPACRDGFGVRVVIVPLGATRPPFSERCRTCGRAFGHDEGAVVLITERDGSRARSIQGAAQGSAP